MRTYSGHSTATASNELYRTNLAKGQTGLSIAFDLPTQTGYDPDSPTGPRRGRQGRRARRPPRPHAHAARRHPAGPDEHVDDDQRHRGVAARRCTSPTPRSTGTPSTALRGTTQNDIVKEYLSRGTYIFPPEPSRRLIVDMVAWCAEHAPPWNPMNVCSYHLQEAGATPVQELAYALATAIGVLDAVRDSGQVRAERFAAGVRLDLVLRQRRHPLRRGDLQAAGVHRDVGPHRPRALRRRRPQGPPLPLRRAGQQPRPHRGPAGEQRAAHRARDARPSRCRSGPGPAASSCRRGTRRSACPARGTSSGRCGCNRCWRSRPTCSSTTTSSTARTSSRRAPPSCATRPRTSSTTCSPWAARSRPSTTLKAPPRVVDGRAHPPHRVRRPGRRRRQPLHRDRRRRRSAATAPSCASTRPSRPRLVADVQAWRAARDDAAVDRRARRAAPGRRSTATT